MNIYLDTSHLQKWQQRTLSREDLNALDRLKNSGHDFFVISLTHIFDIIDRKDGEKAINIAKFIDQLPKKWIRNTVDLKREEIKNALECFKKNQIFEINPFVNDFVDTLEPEPSTALIIPLRRRGSSIETIIRDFFNNSPSERQNSLNKEIQQWARNNALIVTNMRNLANKEKEMQKNLRRVLEDNIVRFNLRESIISAVIDKLNSIVDPINEFINWIIKNPLLISSIWCPYYTQHFMHRNTTMSWKKSHIDDLNHIASLPYVDYLSVDKQIHSFAMQALNFAKRHVPDSWRGRLITSIKDIQV